MGQSEWRRIERETLGFSIDELVEQPEPYTFDNPVTVTTYFVSWSLWALYITCRFWNLSRGEGATSTSWWLSVALFLTEILLLLPSLFSALHMSLYIFFGTPGKNRSSYRLVGQEAPSIDVCITCCGESLDVIMDTVAGAASQDYPRTSFRVFVLDDADDEALEKAIQDYNQSHGTAVTYLARKKLAGESHFYKAGNLRFGLETTERLGKGSVFFASLDVDMIAESDWLRRVIPHLILDAKLALACPAQVRSNASSRTKHVVAKDANMFSGITTCPIQTCLVKQAQRPWRFSN
jgi:cellulose synthase/poly-beta-1,6-N-acetylglucosamine synthase-like glycosyltransferase